MDYKEKALRVKMYKDLNLGELENLLGSDRDSVMNDFILEQQGRFKIDLCCTPSCHEFIEYLMENGIIEIMPVYGQRMMFSCGNTRSPILKQQKGNFMYCNGRKKSLYRKPASILMQVI